MPLDNKEAGYFESLASRVLINRCPYCNVGMVIDTPCIRYCVKCGYRDEGSNIPFKFKLSFKLHQEPNTKPVIVTAMEPDNTLSFQKTFQDFFTAERYIDSLRSLCLPY